MPKSERVPISEAAVLLGMSPQMVRCKMRNNLFKIPIGEVSNPSGKKYNYYIYRAMLNKHLGKVQDDPGEENA